MIRTGRTGRGYALRGAAVVAAVALAGVTAGCKEQPAAGASAAPSVPAGSSSPADDAKPGGGSASPSASAEPESKEPKEPAKASPKPSATRTTPPADPQGEVLMASGSQGGQVRELQARLRQIGHFDRSPTGYYGTVTVAAVQSFQGKRGLPRTGRTDTVTWQKLLGMTHEPTATELNPPTTRPVAKPDKRCLTGRVLCISKNSRTLSWMVDGKVVSSMDVRFGSQYTPTREGTFSVYWKSRHHVSSIYHTAMPYAMFFSGGQAVHYSSDFAARGYNGASHGCVNVRDEGKIAALFAQVRNGDKVVVYQ
ncbi:L,D-transpeptidase family protein [Streptomyces sp. SID9727]|uniref:L,D-transpeptidase family protein n=1 Tax=Streptomyces sp. SID9727 TaxID=2706114 RepID=UPI0013C866DC|nr:L,D-transpeptidase family protein [Streptomyces sp. SID9727]NEC66243.1 L,D-transpeptidase family protein [Streptomyces sp. SID9727]